MSCLLWDKGTARVFLLITCVKTIVKYELPVFDHRFFLMNNKECKTGVKLRFFA